MYRADHRHLPDHSGFLCGLVGVHMTKENATNIIGLIAWVVFLVFVFCMFKF